MDDRLLGSIMKISRMMVEAGAEIYRVEESVMRMCAAYGVKRTDVYATTSNIIVSVEDTDENVRTHTCRVGQISADIEKADRLNSLVRRISATAPDLREIDGEMEKINRTPEYPYWVIMFFYGFIAGAFCIFFGSRSVAETGAAFVIGVTAGTMSSALGGLRVNRLLVRFLCSFWASTAAFICLRTGIIGSADNVIIGNIMTLIPGIGLTNSLRDLFTGDSISGVLRLIEAILLAVAIACGYVAASYIFGGAA